MIWPDAVVQAHAPERIFTCGYAVPKIMCLLLRHECDLLRVIVGDNLISKWYNYNRNAMHERCDVISGRAAPINERR